MFPAFFMIDISESLDVIFNASVFLKISADNTCSLDLPIQTEQLRWHQTRSGMCRYKPEWYKSHLDKQLNAGAVRGRQHGVDAFANNIRRISSRKMSEYNMLAFKSRQQCRHGVKMQVH